MAAPVTLANRQIKKLVEGLKALDGVSNEATKIERYEFDDSLSWNIAKGRDLAEKAQDVYDKGKASIARRLGIVEGMKVTEANAAAVAEFLDEHEKLLDKTQDLPGFLRLSRKALQQAGVKIPGIFANLMPILSDA